MNNQVFASLCPKWSRRNHPFIFGGRFLLHLSHQTALHTYHQRWIIHSSTPCHYDPVSMAKVMGHDLKYEIDQKSGIDQRATRSSIWHFVIFGHLTSFFSPLSLYWSSTDLYARNGLGKFPCALWMVSLCVPEKKGSSDGSTHIDTVNGTGLSPSERWRRKFDPTHGMLGVCLFLKFNTN